MHLHRPISAQIEITDNCNFRCQHCYLLDSSNHCTGQKPNTRNLMRIAEILCSQNVFNIILTGGEPLLYPNVLKQLISYLTAHSINVSINTNLSLLTDDLLDFFIEKKVRNLLISCPSASSSLYEAITNYKNFDHFRSNLEKVLKSGMRYSLNMVVSQYNKHDIINTAKKLKQIGATKFGATPMSLNPLYPRLDLLLSNDEVKKLTLDLLWIRDNLGLSVDIMEALPKCVFPKELLKQDLPFLKRRCQAGLSIIAVAPNGDVRPCTHNPEVYGNILNENLDDIWQRMKPWRSMVLIPDKCKECKVFVRCHGGCRTNAFTFHGKWNAEDVWVEEPIKEKIFPKVTTNLNFDQPIKVVKLKTRYEKNHILICGNTSRQIAIVNDEVCKLLNIIRQSERITLREIAHMSNIEVDNRDFLRIITYLIRNRIIIYDSVSKDSSSDK